MRLDKYLKVSRIIKRRTVANEACGLGRVLVNGKEAKPAVQVKPGDILTIQLGQKTINARIESIQEHVQKADAAAMYTILGEEE